MTVYGKPCPVQDIDYASSQLGGCCNAIINTSIDPTFLTVTTGRKLSEILFESIDGTRVSLAGEDELDNSVANFRFALQVAIGLLARVPHGALGSCWTFCNDVTDVRSYFDY